MTRLLDEGGASGDMLSGIDALGGLLPSNFAAIFPMLDDLHGRMAQKRDLDGDASYDAAIGAVETLILDNKDAYDRATAAGLTPDEARAVADAYFSGDNGGARLFDEGILGAGGVSGAGGAAGAGMSGAGSDSGVGISGAGSGGASGGRLGGAAGSGVPIAGTVTGVAGDAGAVTGASTNPESLSPDEKGAVLVLALSRYAETQGDDSLSGLLRAETSRMMTSGNLVYEDLKDSASRYLPARALADYLKLRYVWNRNLNGGALARGGEYLFFTVYSAEIITGSDGGDVDYMAFPAAYKDELYLPDDYAYEAFGLWSEAIPGTDAALIISPKINDCAAELLSRLLLTAGA
jgi:hypothetical protein